MCILGLDGVTVFFYILGPVVFGLTITSAWRDYKKDKTGSVFQMVLAAVVMVAYFIFVYQSLSAPVSVETLRQLSSVAKLQPQVAGEVNAILKDSLVLTEFQAVKIFCRAEKLGKPGEEQELWESITKPESAGSK